MTKELIIETDVSDYIIKEILIQENSKEKQQLLKYIFKIMNSVEQNYTIIEKKILTIIQTVKK